MAKAKPKPLKSAKSPKLDKPDKVHPGHPLLAKLTEKAQKHSHKHGVMTDLLSTPPTLHIVALIDQVHHRPDTAALAAQEGDERLIETLDGILGLCEFAKETAEAAGLPVSDLCTRTIAALESVLGGVPNP